MSPRIGVFLAILIFAQKIHLDSPSQWIVWNVGQGQWVTWVQDESCIHFDMGGERAPWAEVMQNCRQRRNEVIVSHWDWDHIAFIGQAHHYLPQFCVHWPPDPPLQKGKQVLHRRTAQCTQPISLPMWTPKDGKRSNDRSRVVLADHGQMLLPGDSPQHQEILWSEMGLPLKNVKVLILGHHGSRTSTSEHLLSALRRLRFSVASSRERRYGHPHAEVREALQKRRVPLLTTEDWGHIFIIF